MQRPQMDSSGEIDEHDLPTEPLPEISDLALPGEETIPAPAPQKQPIPSGRGAPPQRPQYPQQPQGGQVYPYLPPMAGGQADEDEQSVRNSFFPALLPVAVRGLVLRIPIPRCVGLFFVIVQLLLLVRFVLKMINLPDDGVWVSAVYTLSSVWVLPFRLFIQPLAFLPTVEIYTLLAVLVYGLVSRLLVRLLKVLMQSH